MEWAAQKQIVLETRARSIIFHIGGMLSVVWSMCACLDVSNAKLLVDTSQYRTPKYSLFSRCCCVYCSLINEYTCAFGDAVAAAISTTTITSAPDHIDADYSVCICAVRSEGGAHNCELHKHTNDTHGIEETSTAKDTLNELSTLAKFEGVDKGKK